MASRHDLLHVAGGAPARLGDLVRHQVVAAVSAAAVSVASWLGSKSPNVIERCSCSRLRGVWGESMSRFESCGNGRQTPRAKFIKRFGVLFTDRSPEPTNATPLGRAARYLSN